MTFGPYDELRVKRLDTGFITELYKDGECKAKLFDSLDSIPKPENVVVRLMNSIEKSKGIP